MGLLTFVDLVKTKLTSLGVNTSVTIGTQQPARQNNQGTGTANRIVFVPKGGTYDAAIQPGRNPRPLHTLHENLDVYVWARGPTTPANPPTIPQPIPPDEMSSYAAAWDLKESLMVAMRRVGYGTYKLGSLRHLNGVNKTEKINGWEMVFDMKLQVPVLDLVHPTAMVDEIEAPVIAYDVQGNLIGPP